MESIYVMLVNSNDKPSQDEISKYADADDIEELRTLVAQFE